MRTLRCSLGHDSKKSQRTASLSNLLMGKCTCENISRGPGVGVELEGQLEPPSPFSLTLFLLRVRLSGVGAQAATLSFESQSSRQYLGSIGKRQAWRRGV